MKNYFCCITNFLGKDKNGHSRQCKKKRLSNDEMFEELIKHNYKNETDINYLISRIHFEELIKHNYKNETE